MLKGSNGYLYAFIDILNRETPIVSLNFSTKFMSKEWLFNDYSLTQPPL